MQNYFIQDLHLSSHFQENTDDYNFIIFCFFKVFLTQWEEGLHIPNLNQGYEFITAYVNTMFHKHNASQTGELCGPVV